MSSYSVESAPSGRSTCIKCKKAIEKGHFRIGFDVTVNDVDWKVPAHCNVREINGFDSLKDQEKQTLLAKQHQRPEPPPKKREASATDDDDDDADNNNNNSSNSNNNRKKMIKAETVVAAIDYSLLPNALTGLVFSFHGSGEKDDELLKRYIIAYDGKIVPYSADGADGVTHVITSRKWNDAYEMLMKKNVKIVSRLFPWACVKEKRPLKERPYLIPRIQLQ